MRLLKLSYQSHRIFLLGTIKGMTAERKRVARAFKSCRPDVIALHISDEALVGLEKVVKGKVKKVGLSRYETAYARKLATIVNNDPSQYGEVQVPPPALVEGFELGTKHNVPIVAYDMDENAYTDIYVKNITTFQLLRHSMRFNRIKKKKFKVSTPEEFVLEWDKALTRLKGFRNLELKREEYMAKRLVALCKKYNNILAVAELERMDGIAENFKRLVVEQS